MECSFEDFIVQRFPPFLEPAVREGYQFLKENITAIAKEGANKLVSLHPGCHADKLGNFANFAKFLGEAGPNTKVGDVLKAVHDHWDQCVDPCHNLLDDIANDPDNIPKMLEKCREALQIESDRMFQQNFFTQGAVVMAQYALLWYLWTQSKRGDAAIDNALTALRQIQEKHIVPAMILMYGVHEDDEEKYSAFKSDISRADVEKAEIHLDAAADRLGDYIKILEDQQQAAWINAVGGAVAMFVSGWFTMGLSSGTKALYDVQATGTALFAQQAAFTGLSATATVGLGLVSGKHLWNAVKCGELITKMVEMKTHIERHKKKLAAAMVLFQPQRER